MVQPFSPIANTIVYGDSYYTLPPCKQLNVPYRCTSKLSLLLVPNNLNKVLIG